MPMCPDREILSAYIDGEIPAPWDGVIAEHVESCATCRALHARLEETRRILREPVDLLEPMERVRQRILASPPARSRVISPWRRQVSLPLPVAAVAALLLLTLGVALAMSIARTNVGFIRVTRAPTGGTEYQFAVPADKAEALLKQLGGEEVSREDVITLPKNVKLLPVGQPKMGTETEFLRKKP
jgi:predicted anti-sigma-YlaC factor YlaD